MAVGRSGRQDCLEQGASVDSDLLPLLKSLSAASRLDSVLFRIGLVVLPILFAAQAAPLLAQNIPPMIGDHVGKPKLRFPNPLESAQKGASQSSQSSQSGQTTASAMGEREIQAFLENWRSSLAKKDLEALSYCYLQTEALRVYWESQEFSGWEPFKTEIQRRFASPEGVQFEIKEPKTSAFGRFAWVTAHCFWQTWTGANPKTQEGLMTLVLEKRRSVWLILHQHISIAAAPPPVTLSTK
jgi:ketosteroid isomerase-like protein